MTLLMHRGSKVLIEGPALQIAGLAALALVAAAIETPPPLWLAATMIIFGYVSPRDGAALERGALDRQVASGKYGTTVQIGNAAGVATVGAVYVASK